MFRLVNDTKMNEFSFECKGCDSTIAYKSGATVPLHCPMCKTLIDTRPDQLRESIYYRKGYYKSAGFINLGGI